MKNSIRFLPHLLYLLLSLTLFCIYKENPLRALAIFSGISFWFFFGLFKKNFSYASLLTLIFFFPLNITIKVDGSISPFVSNVIVNYLIPHISVIDLFSGLLIFSYFIEKKKFKIFHTFLFFIFFFFLSLLLNPTILGLIGILRFTLYAISIKYIISNLKSSESVGLFVTIGISVLLQFSLSAYQFVQESMLGLSWLGESQLVSGSIGSSFLSLGGRQILRAYGTFPHPNVLAGFLLLAIFLSLIYFEKEKKKWVLGIVIIGLINLFLTFSRLHIFLGLLLSSTLLLNFLKEKKLFSFLFLDRFLSLFSGSDISVGERVKLLKASVDISLSSPNGVGWGMFVKSMENAVIRTSSGILLLQPVHNVFLLLIAENGVLIGLGMSLTILISWFRSFKSLNIWLGITGFISIFFIACFDHYLLTLPQGIFILIFSII